MSVKFKTNIEGTAFNDITGLATNLPLANGTAAVGTSTAVARQDHVHGTDTSKASTVSPTFTGTVVLPSGQALIAPALGTVASGNIAACTGLPIINGTTGTLSVARGGTGTTTSTGSGNVVLANTPLLKGPTFEGVGVTFNGTTSGTTKLKAPAVAGSITLTLPAETDDTLVGKATTDTLYNKTLFRPEIQNYARFLGNTSGYSLLQASAVAGATVFTLPATDDTLVGKETVDTLYNKTLTTPKISSIVNTGTLTLPTSTDTLVGRATTDTLTNKTLRRTIVYKGADYTLQASDAGKVILLTTTGINITIPINVFTAGDEFTIINDSQTNATAGTTIGACNVTVTTGAKAFIVATQYQNGASFSLGSRRGLKFICALGGSNPRFYGWRS